MCPAAANSSNTRWCPTPEQVMVLEELYRRGLRTPSAPQIQKITAHLSLHGHIQGKNVFYWFQNHKARDRQKLRKKLLLLHHHQFLLHSHPQNIILFHQGSGVCEEAPVMRTYGHDSMMIKEAGPTQLPCKPLRTLQLFPLTSPTANANATAATANHASTSSFLNAYP